MKPQTTQQQGMALVEALIASAILGIGLVGATQLTLQTLNTASQTRQHTVAQQLAHEAMDCMRALVSMPDPVQVIPCPAEETLVIQGVTYTRQAQSTAAGTADLSDLHVRVSWPTLGQKSPTDSPEQGSGTASLIEWHSSVSALPSWLGVSLP
jgi:Tfp pilus assembly protein PilV